MTGLSGTKHGVVLAAAALGLLLTACTGLDMGAEDRGDSGMTSDTATQLDDSSDTDSESVEPVWFGLDGVLTVTKGALSDAQISVRIFGQETGDGVLCEHAIPVTSFAALESSDPAWVFHWAELALDTSPVVECPGVKRVPDQLRIGLGALYPDLEPGLADLGLQDAANSVYTAYAALPEPAGEGLDGTVLAYGFAGTVQGRAGEGVAVVAAPVPDGEYVLTGWYVFQLD